MKYTDKSSTQKSNYIKKTNGKKRGEARFVK